VLFHIEIYPFCNLRLLIFISKRILAGHALIKLRDLILVQYQYNNCTITPHMRVSPSMWAPPSCEGLLYWCCKPNIFLKLRARPCYVEGALAALPNLKSCPQIFQVSLSKPRKTKYY
jgi:hypothetical protein